MFRLVTRVLRPFCQQSKKPPYIHPYNVNLEQERDWVKKVEKELKVQSTPVPDLLPRRKRRVYDKQKIDLDISGYAAWRVYGEDRMFKVGEFEAPVVLKLMLQPKWLKHCFGEGYDPDYNVNTASREYYFEDSNLSQYMLYDFRHTTMYQPNIPGYDYENQQNIEPRRRKVFRYHPTEFWAMEKEFEFRVNATKYADHHKFKEWLVKTIKDSKGKKSYDEFIDEKFTRVYTFNKPQDAVFYEEVAPLAAFVDSSHFAPLVPIRAETDKEKDAPKQQKKSKKEKKSDKKGEKLEKDDKAATKQDEEVKDILKEAEELPDDYVEVKRSSIKFAKKLPEEFRIDEKDSISAFAAVFDEQNDKNAGEASDESAKKDTKKEGKQEKKGDAESTSKQPKKKKQPKE